jgi:glycosyltransferase involved in cell wall biosynthesis
MRTHPTLAVIIVAWREAALIADAVAQARLIGDEVIVADGGSPDGTPDLARRAGATVVSAPKAGGSKRAPGRKRRGAT